MSVRYISVRSRFKIAVSCQRIKEDISTTHTVSRLRVWHVQCQVLLCNLGSAAVIWPEISAVKELSGLGIDTLSPWEQRTTQDFFDRRRNTSYVTTEPHTRRHTDTQTYTHVRTDTANYPSTTFNAIPLPNNDALYKLMAANGETHSSRHCQASSIVCVAYSLRNKVTASKWQNSLTCLPTFRRQQHL